MAASNRKTHILIDFEVDTTEKAMELQLALSRYTKEALLRRPGDEILDGKHIELALSISNAQAILTESHIVKK
jgi:hypothetical protein